MTLEATLGARGYALRSLHEAEDLHDTSLLEDRQATLNNRDDPR